MAVQFIKTQLFAFFSPDNSDKLHLLVTSGTALYAVLTWSLMTKTDIDWTCCDSSVSWHTSPEIQAIAAGSSADYFSLRGTGPGKANGKQTISDNKSYKSNYADSVLSWITQILFSRSFKPQHEEILSCCECVLWGSVFIIYGSDISQVS